MGKVIDLRSDTATVPTEAMRRAIAQAEVGDDVLREDPTVNRLEERAAQMFGKEAAVLVTSGTQGNATSMLAHTRPGDLVFCDARAHVSRFEAGGYAALAGVVLEKLDAPRGVITGEMVERAVDPYNDHLANPRLIWVENTHNAAGGACTSLEVMRGLRQVADRHGFALHVDGARIFNAAAKLGVSVAALAADADSVQFCLSKGLGAPVGSLVVGGQEFCKVVRKKRKLLGGGLRQAGIIAAAGLVAFEEVLPLLPKDHANARLLAEGIAAIPALTIKPEEFETNIVFFGYDTARVNPDEFVSELAKRGILVGRPSKQNRSRAVLHHQISTDDVKTVLAAMRRIAGVAVPA